jgi:hypothetical protein
MKRLRSSAKRLRLSSGGTGCGRPVPKRDNYPVEPPHGVSTG